MGTVAQNLQRLQNAKSAIADAIVSKGGSVSVGDGFEAFPSAINALETGGIELDPTNDASLFTRILQGYGDTTYSIMYNSQIKYVVPYAFSYIKLSGTRYTIDLPNCSFIGSNAFAFASMVGTINLSMCEEIGESAFYSCHIASSISLPMCRIVGSSAFWIIGSFTSPLPSFNMPNCEIVHSCGFRGALSVNSLSFPKCTYVGDSAFTNAMATSLYFPECTTIGSYAFASCRYATIANFPKCEIIPQSAFYSCTSLTTAFFSKCVRIQSSAFFKCTKLVSLYLQANSVCTLSNSTVFGSTPFASLSGHIYVPASLVNSYKASTNWAYFSNIISGLQ